MRPIGNRQIIEERASSKEAIWKYEWYTELSSMINSCTNSA
jgi:hypothetical protein